jgi:hypothetical protein
MKVVSVTMMILMTGVGLQARETQHNSERTVAVCMEGIGPLALLRVAQGMASKMFTDIDVNIDWRHGLRDCPAQGIVISLTYNTPDTLYPGSLAYAAPYEGTHVRLFCDRIIRFHDVGLEAHLLAHVLAHEITHILQGICRHSDSGVMKAQWDSHDFDQMLFKSLAFTNVDIRLIHAGLADRTSNAASLHSARNSESAAVTEQ